MQPTTMSAATGVYLSAKKAPLEVRSAVYTPPGDDEIVIRNVAVAVNPLDWFKRDSGDIAFKWIKYPFIMGSDTAGEVVEVGAKVKRFSVGDRVLGHAVGMDERSNKSSEGAFQTYTILRQNVTSHIPDFISFEQACVLPLGLSTAASGLFMKNYLSLQPPSNQRKHTGETILIWGGSTSVGCNAIQLARHAGYEVFTTASTKNHHLLLKIGATKVFDYNSPTVIQDITQAFTGKNAAGALAIGNGSTNACIDVLSHCKGRKFVAQASADLPPGGFPTNSLGWIPFGLSMLSSVARTTWKSKASGIEVKFIWGSDPAWNEVGGMIYEGFLPQALSQATYIPAPEPIVLAGWDKVDEGLNLNRQGVSARKVVIRVGN
ncbi:hypothetical protein R9X50_00267200 [Acrodontium crateriforme]|uniref:Enoyl reductase (ER) domain-containing protein n=1 Tax=Acrodontium crateriforme TaxID=150365 RepID=A0AAQ3M1Z5_9PEZI|nr:hypothetical protein R9X50_00267200 [Acrodontium crateriforme]